MAIKHKELEMILKFEPYVLGLFCLGLILHLSRISVEPLLVISASILAQFYLFRIFRKRQDLKGINRFMRIALLTIMSIGVMSLLFSLLNWPGKFQMIIVFLIAFLSSGLIIAAKQIEITKIISKQDSIVLFGLFILLLSGSFNLI